MATKKRFIDEDDIELELEAFDPVAGAEKIPVDITRGQKPLSVLKEIPAEQFIPYRNKKGSDFSRMSDDKIDKLAESFLTVGVLQPVVARVCDDSYYEILAGETRWEGCKRAGILVPTIVYENCDDNLAEQIFALTNVLSREKTQRDMINGWWHYYEAVKQAKKTPYDPNVTILAPKAQTITERQIQKYARIHDLPEKILAMIDAGIYTIDTADILAGLTTTQQQDIALWELPLKKEEAKALRVLSERGEWNEENVLNILQSKKPNTSEYTTIMNKAIRAHRRRIMQQVSPAAIPRLDSILDEALALYFEKHPDDRIIY